MIKTWHVNGTDIPIVVCTQSIILRRFYLHIFGKYLNLNSNNFVILNLFFGDTNTKSGNINIMDYCVVAYALKIKNLQLHIKV